MATCLFGGTFNPFHNGHLAVISHVKAVLAFDRMVLFPCAIPPHKSVENLVPARDRLDMVAAAVRDMEGFEVSDIELHRQGPSFTIDTLEEFEQICSDELFLLMGADSFLGMTSWKDMGKIFQKVALVIMPREEQRDMSIFSSFIDENVSTGYTWKKDRFVHETMKEIIVCPVPRIDISSTMVREKIRRGLSVSDFVPDGTVQIIAKKELYK